MIIAAEYCNISAHEKRANPGAKGKVTIVAPSAAGREVGHSAYVAGKAEARKIAEVFKATPWNF